jgi:hypothetical protein
MQEPPPRKWDKISSEPLQNLVTELPALVDEPKTVENTEVELVTNEGYSQVTEEVKEVTSEVTNENNLPLPIFGVARDGQVENSVVEPAQEIVVGSVVLWSNCPSHWESWSPIVVEIIHEDGMVKLDIARPDYLVHIKELRLA